MGRGISRIGPRTGLPALLLVLLPWALLGGGAGCISKPPPPPTELCPSTGIGATPASPSIRRYVYDTLGKIVDARGVDWSGQQRSGVELDGSKGGCFQGGGITGTWDIASTWDTFHLTAALSVMGTGQPMRVHAVHPRNYGDGVSIEPSVPCPNGSLNPWLYVHANHFEDIHDDAIESDGLCSVSITNNLIERAFVAFAFRNRSSEPDRSGSANKVIVENNLVRLHSFPNNWEGIPDHGAFWKWAHRSRGPRIVVRNNRFLAFDAVRGLFPYVTRVLSCENNVFLFAGSEAEWAQALTLDCDDEGDDGLCTGERVLALSSCFTVITKPDTQSEADFLAEYWDPYAAYWKAASGADDE
jgi:hypothetical protein